MKSLELNVKEPGDVILPAELATSGLTPIEIGSIFVLFAMATGTLNPDHLALTANDDIQLSLTRLKNDGILTVDIDEDDNMYVDIDLTKIE